MPDSRIVPRPRVGLPAHLQRPAPLSPPPEWRRDRLFREPAYPEPAASAEAELLTDHAEG